MQILRRFNGFGYWLLLGVVAVTAFAVIHTASFAISPPPAKIVEAKVSPECLVVQPSYLADQPAHYGTGSKGPAIAITNKCSDSLTLADISTSTTAEGSKASALPMELVLQGAAGYRSMTFTTDGDDCSQPTWRDWFSVGGGAHCKFLFVPAGDTVTLPMFWGSYYKISGNLGTSQNMASGDAGISIEGRMINPRDPSQAIDSNLKDAAQGNVDAMWELGMLYSSKKDDAEAAKWYQKAAELGDARAQISIAYLYERGTGVKQDYPQAMNWYKKAASQSNVKGEPAFIAEQAKCRLGALYAFGDSVPHDYSEVVKWWNVPEPDMAGVAARAEKGDAKAQVQLGNVYRDNKCQQSLTVEQSSQRLEEMAKWYKKAADQGDADGQCELGKLYDVGGHYNMLRKPNGGAEENWPQALHWYQKSAEQGHTEAKFRLAALYKLGLGVAKDEGRAAKLINAASEEGNPEAQNWRGSAYYYSGRGGLKQDYAEAYFWMSLAKKGGARVSPWQFDESKQALSSEQSADVDKRVQDWKPAPPRKLDEVTSP